MVKIGGYIAAVRPEQDGTKLQVHFLRTDSFTNPKTNKTVFVLEGFEVTTKDDCRVYVHDIITRASDKIDDTEQLVGKTVEFVSEKKRWRFVRAA